MTKLPSNSYFYNVDDVQTERHSFTIGDPYKVDIDVGFAENRHLSLFHKVLARQHICFAKHPGGLSIHRVSIACWPLVSSGLQFPIFFLSVISLIERELKCCQL